ncbi:Protein of unknown function (DUF2459) [Synechococcus sp. PCC 6312]|nr:Protein of unknown function (DUF2459) [Synechococcus sp. PCC 6312]
MGFEDWPEKIGLGLLSLGLGLVPPCSMLLGQFNPSPPAADPTSSITIYVYGDYVHTNILVPVTTPTNNWRNYLELGQLGENPRTDLEYLGFGWGERELYRNLTRIEDIPADQAWRALFHGRSPATLHVQGFPQLPQAPLATFLIPLRINERDYQALTEFLLASFERDAQDRPIRLNPSRQAQSSFYAATGHYSAWNTCNSWTAKALAEANIQPPFWDTLALPLFYHLQWYKTCQPE